MATEDALIGLRFEVGGGLGRMTGHVIGKVGHLYLVRKSGADHLELLELDDIRSARFYTGAEAPVSATAAAAPNAATEPPKKRLSDQIRRHFGAKDGA